VSPLRCISVALLTLGSVVARAGDPAPALHYQLQGSTAGPDGGFDYMSVDAQTGHVFVGRSFGVEQMADGQLTTVLARQGVASVLQISPDLLITTNGDSDTATLMLRSSGKVLADIPTGKAPDGAAYDAASGLAFVMNGESEDISVIDIAQRRAVAQIALGTAPEAAVADGAGHLFVNLEAQNRIAVIDIASQKLTAHYALSGCDEPTGLAFDPHAHLLASACHNGVLKFIDNRDGHDRGQLEIGQGADASIFDPERRLGFVPCLDGTLTIYRLDGAGAVVATQRLATRNGARTAAYDSRHDRLYLAVADVERDAAGHYLRARRNFRILTVAPGN